MKRITVIMPVRDQVGHTLRALRALTRAHFDGELVLVDQASSDGSAEAVTGLLAGRLPVRVLTVAESTSYAAAVNRALALAEGDSVLLLDNDTELQPGALAALASALEAEPGVAAAGPKLLYPTGQVQEAGLALPLWLVPFPLGVNERGDDHRFNCPRPAFALSTSCLLVRRSALQSVGGLDEGLVWGFEAADLALALRKERLRVVYEPRAVCLHQGGATLNRYPALPRVESNRQRFLSRWGVDLLKRVASYLDRLAQDGPRRFLIYGTGDAARHLANTLEVGGYEVAGFLTSNGVSTVGRYPAYRLDQVPEAPPARVLIGSPYVREAEDRLAAAGMLAGAALPILLD